jgi:hypothetical protein
MASIGNPIPGIGGVGIRAPNLKNRFRVRFLNEEKQKLDVSDQLSAQAIRVDGLEQRRVDMGMLNSTIIDFQDDVTNVAFKGLLKLQEMESFIVAIDILDGADTILRTTYLQGTKLLSFGHAKLDYAAFGSKHELEFDAYFPHRVGQITDLISENPVAAAVLNTLQGAQVRVNAGKNLADPVSCELCAYFNFVATEFDFDQKKAD